MPRPRRERDQEHKQDNLIMKILLGRFGDCVHRLSLTVELTVTPQAPIALVRLVRASPSPARGPTSF